MDNITSALITTTFVFMAVFIPVCFIGGTTGTFYTQFGLTMAVAVAISALNALTFSPALCALIMTPHTTGENGEKMSFSSRFHVAFDASFQRMVNKYKFGVFFFLKRKWLAGALLAVAFSGLFVLMKTTKTGLVPQEDMGTIFMNVQTPPGSNLSETKRVMDMVEKRIKDIEEIKMYSKVTGNSIINGQGASNGQFIIRLKDWSEREGKTGLIMLIGLLSKTAILLTEYASERRKHGMSIAQAALSAAKVRLRPILMTSLTMIFGLLPMMFATGVGANGNISLGVGTVGGMLIGTIALLFIVPVLFTIFQYLQEKLMPERNTQQP